MRTLTQHEIGLVGGADGEEEVDTCEMLGEATGALAGFLLLQRTGLSGTSYFNSQLTDSAVSASIDGACSAAAEWVSDEISAMESQLQEAGDYLEMFNYYRLWGSPL